MTSEGQSGTRVPIRVDGVRLSALVDATAGSRQAVRQTDESHRFWASSQRGIASTHRDIMEVSFGTPRLINHLAFEVSRFPLVLRVEYLDRNGDWQGITHTQRRATKRHPRRKPVTEAVRMVISESVPAKVNSAKAVGHHPQHFGKSHWQQEAWKVIPVKTSKIRFVIARNHQGKPPRNPHGHAVPYSIAIKNLAIGYRVLSNDDLPPTPPDTTDPGWGSSQDILGSQTVYSTYTQPANAVVDGNLSTYWRSEPQPFPFAVVNMFLDLRDTEGEAPVVDRFWMDPITTGVQCNLYYSNTVPEGEFDGSSEPIPLTFREEIGGPTYIRNASDNQIQAINLGRGRKAGVSLVQPYHRMRYDQPWWVGIDAGALVATLDPAQHPLVTLGTTQILQEGAEIKVVAQSGSAARIPLTPSLHKINARYRLVIAYHPYDPASQRDAYFRIVYMLTGGYEPVVDEVATIPLPNVGSPLKVGLPPDSADYATDMPAATIFGLVVKSEALTDETEQWFLDEGGDYVADAENSYLDRYTAQNARLRMHPMFVSSTNQFGIVGGAGNRFGEMEWTPIMRDYSLKQGYLHLPPTKAKFWKFEMTGLMAQPYENFLPIEREVLVFPPDVVAAHSRVAGGNTNSAHPSGVATTGNIADAVTYSDALQATRAAQAPPDATEVLVVKDPVQAQQVAQTGWVWNYRPWHTGSSAPKFLGTQQHRYESLRVRHTQKVSFFAAIREIKPLRTDYTFGDDTPEYVEHMMDQSHIDEALTSGVEYEPGGVRSTSASAKITSKALASYRMVRGVQFASQETDSIQVLTDPDFNASHLDFWTEYGDADIERLGRSDIVVNRGWFPYSYRDLETLPQFGTYGSMEGIKYGQLEGNNNASGYAEGGISSEPYTPSGAGAVIAMAKVSGSGSMNAPIIVEIVSAYDNSVVASTQRWVRDGETDVLRVAYTPGSVINRRTYADIETLVSAPTTYGQLEGRKYYQLESENELPTDLYARVRQQGPTDDSFHIHRLALYDSPVAWFFSNDDGVTWWQAIDVRNNPYGVLIFPPSDDPEAPGVGRTLRWRAEIYKENGVVNGLHIRPWYGSRSHTVDRSHGLEAIGPNQSIFDDFPATHQHPMWQDRFNPIEHTYEEPVEVEPYWRNLVVNPGGEGPGDDQWIAEGGNIFWQGEWTV